MFRPQNRLSGLSNRATEPFGFTAQDSISEAFPPGHFYSVVPTLGDIDRFCASRERKCAPPKGVDLRVESQRALLVEFQKMREDTPFYSSEKRIRFDIENDAFSYDDAPILHYFMRKLRPRTVIEIGSGWSSACMLDTSDIYLDSSVKFTFIDPNCDRLRQRLLPSDGKRVRIIEQKLQSADLDIFRDLGENDLLFIDSSHVLKLGSDLEAIMFDVLPSLAPGVFIHFHDVRFPFRYDDSSVKRGVLWNEAHFLRAFLMYNNTFEIQFWLNCLINTSVEDMKNCQFLPLDGWDKRFNESRSDFSDAGGSIYLRKIR